MVLAMVLSIIPAFTYQNVKAEEATEITTAEAFKEAITNGGTVKLMNDIRVDGWPRFSQDNPVNIDLNGNTVTLDGPIISSNGASGDITVKNGNIVAPTDTELYNEYAFFYIQGPVTMNIEDVTFDGKSNVNQILYVNGSANITMTNTTITGGNNVAGSGDTAGFAVQNGAGTVVLNNCTIKDNVYAGSDQTSKDMFIGAQQKVTINGGSYGNIFMNQNEYSETHGPGYLIINDGEYEAIYVEYDAYLAHVTINEGTVDELVINGDANGGEVSGEIIAGGTYGKITIVNPNTDVDNYVATGYKSINNPNGTITVTKDENYVSVKVDGNDYIKNVKIGTEITMPADDALGYYAQVGEDMIAVAPGAGYTVHSEVNFYSIGNITVTIEKGAAVRMMDPTGVRFKANISANEDILDQSKGIVTEGMLITANDLFEQNGSILTKESNYKYIDVENTGWLSNQVGQYCASVVNINPANYTREFVATAYVDIHYLDGSVKTIYGEDGVRYSNPRSATYIAKKVKEDINYYNSLTDSEKANIDKFVAAE